MNKRIRNLGFLLDCYENGHVRVNADDNFDELSKKYFIKSILVGASTGIIRLTNICDNVRIDDGAKRINAIMQFISDEFPIDEFVLRDIGIEADRPMYYSELKNTEFLDKFRNYEFFVEEYTI